MQAPTHIHKLISTMIEDQPSIFQTPKPKQRRASSCDSNKDLQSTAANSIKRCRQKSLSVMRSAKQQSELVTVQEIYEHTRIIGELQTEQFERLKLLTFLSNQKYNLRDGKKQIEDDIAKFIDMMSLNNFQQEKDNILLTERIEKDYETLIESSKQFQDKMTQLQTFFTNQIQTIQEEIVTLEAQHKLVKENTKDLQKKIIQLNSKILNFQAEQKLEKEQSRHDFNIMLTNRQQYHTITNKKQRTYNYTSITHSQNLEDSVVDEADDRLFHSLCSSKDDLSIQIVIDIVYYLLTETNLNSSTIFRKANPLSPSISKIYPNTILIDVIQGQIVPREPAKEQINKEKYEFKRAISILISEDDVDLVHEAFEVVLKHTEGKLRCVEFSVWGMVLEDMAKQMILVEINPKRKSKRRLTVNVCD